jgi:single-strand DNA-binding protein
MIIGRILEFKDENYITVSTTRNFKNADGVYESDFIEIKLSEIIMKKTKEYCKKGDLVSIKGRIENGNIIVAESISFLNSN